MIGSYEITTASENLGSQTRLLIKMEGIDDVNETKEPKPQK